MAEIIETLLICMIGSAGVFLVNHEFWFLERRKQQREMARFYSEYRTVYASNLWLSVDDHEQMRLFSQREVDRLIARNRRITFDSDPSIYSHGL